MTATVLDQLPLLAGAPGGAAGLRRLILDLAVSGRLISQEPADGSAESLATLAAGVKATMGIRRMTRVGAAVNGSLSSRDLPSGWVQVRLGDLTTKLGAGSTPLGGKQVYTPDGVMFLRSQNVWNEGLRLEDVARIPAAIHADMSGTHVVAGDLLFNITGASIGRCAAVPSPFEGGNVSQHVVIVRPALAELQPYLHKVLISDLVQDAVMAEQVGVSREGLSVAKLSEFKIPLPPLQEQHRIVAKVDELMALCDRLEARQQDAEAAHARLVQALLDSLSQARDAEEFQACWQRLSGQFEMLLTTDRCVDDLMLAVSRLAISGRLVQPSSPSAMSASLVATLLEHWRKRSARRAALASVPANEHRYPLPPSWAWLRFGFIAETRLGKMLDAAKNSGMMKPYLRNTNVQWDRFELGDVKELRLEVSELEEFAVKAGDLLVCEGGEPGRCAVWRDETREIYFQKALHRVRPLGGISPDYLKLCLQVDAATGVLGHLFTGATIKHLTGEKLERYAVPVPPPEEQRRIVAKVTELRALCDHLKARIAAARAKHAQLAEALVEQALA